MQLLETERKYHLAQYPDTIAELATELLGLDAEVEDLKQCLAKLEAFAEIKVANNEKLKNDTQRKATKLQLLFEDPQYISLKAELQDQERARGLKAIELNRVRDQFAIAKLELKVRIAGVGDA